MKGLILVGFYLLSFPVFAKEAILKQVKGTVNLKNEAAGIAISLTEANTYLICKTFFRQSGESSSESNSIEPYPDAILNFVSPLPPGEMKPLTIQFKQDYRIESPSRWWYRSKDCELGLSISLEAVVETSGEKLAINNIYGNGIDINRGFPLLNTKETGATTLKIDKDFEISLSLRVEQSGTRYSNKEGKQVPFCTLSVYRTSNKTAKIGFSYTDIPCPNP